MKIYLIELNISKIYIYEIILTILYIYLFLFSIIIFPINLVIGIICILVLPGYNLLNIWKPEFDTIRKLGYSIIMSLAIENILMLFSYIFLYDLTKTKSSGFFFNSILLLLAIQFINIILIILNLLINFKDKRNISSHHSIIKRKISFNKIERKICCILILYIISLIFLLIVTFKFSIKNNKYSIINDEYKANFLFFTRVPLIFYILLFSSILCLTYLIFYSKNIYIQLFSLSLFLYCLWILPYLQTMNYFSHDVYKLSLRYKSYQQYGIRIVPGSAFKIHGFGFRYTTSFFTTILLVNALNLDLFFVLAFIYPLIFIFIPFYFYSIFKKFSAKNLNHKCLLINTILAITTVQFIKCAHSATTMVLGFFIFIVLIIEYYEFIIELKDGINWKNFFFILFLYLFLCVTHFEETFYFLLIIIYITILLPFLNKEIKENNAYKRRAIIFNGFLFTLSINIFYIITLEFFGKMSYYYFNIVGDNYFFGILYDYYLKTKLIKFPILNGEFTLSILAIGIIFLIIFSFFSLNILIYFKFQDLLLKLGRNILISLDKVIIITRSILIFKVFPILILILSIVLLLMLNFFYYQFLQEQGLFLIPEILLSYSLIIFHLFLFFRGLYYYNRNRYKQNYFLICIFAPFHIMVILFISGNVLLTFYILNARFLPLFIILNLIIIQNTYLKDLLTKKKRNLVIFIITILFLGVFVSLNKIGWE